MLIGSSALEATRRSTAWARAVHCRRSIYFKNGPQLCSAGPHRIVSLLTAEAVDELGLRIGDEAIAVVKSTNVIVEVPSSREVRS